MPHHRFFIHEDLEKGKNISLPPEEIRHLQVMRCKTSDVVEIINGKNILAKAEITQLHKDKAILCITDISLSSPPSFSIHLYQALTQSHRLETIIEKATELGVNKFILFPSLHAERNLSSIKELRLQKIIISALKQCGRLDLPEITFYKSLYDIKKLEGSSYFGDIRDTAPSFASHFTKKPLQNIFIGPEKGFAEEEVFYLENTLHATGIHLHSNILRAETAAICSLAQIWLSQQ